jgi:predicted PurR-regulated permease PerM
VAETIVAILAGAAALYLGQEIFAPFALALLLVAIFRPLVRGLASVRIPPPVSATLITLACLGLIVVGGVLLSRPLQAWIQKAPQTLAAARTKLEKLRKPVQQVSKAVEKVGEEVGVGQTGQAPGPGSGPQSTALLSRVFGTTAGLVSGFIQILVLAFLILATGDLFHRKMAAVMPAPVKGTREATLYEAEGVVRNYLVVTALINLGQGVVVGLAMWLIGMPNPALWGVLTFALEFIPYIGGALMILFLTITAIATSEGLGPIVLPGATYLAITTLQNNVVSPFAYGNRLNLNPIVVLLGVLVGWFFWGVAGAFVAVPALAAIKVFADHCAPKSRLSVVLGE